MVLVVTGGVCVVIAECKGEKAIFSDRLIGFVPLKGQHEEWVLYWEKKLPDGTAALAYQGFTDRIHI